MYKEDFKSQWVRCIQTISDDTPLGNCYAIMEGTQSLVKAGIMVETTGKTAVFTDKFTLKSVLDFLKVN